jgi:hypothetical protein
VRFEFRLIKLFFEQINSDINCSVEPHISKNRSGNLLRHENKTFHLNLMYLRIFIFKISLLIIIEDPKRDFAWKS